jgi:predicted amidophosphoribosyltransferase
MQEGAMLFKYEGAMRALILEAKADNSYAALAKLAQLVLADPRLPPLFEWAEGLIAAPSSFWGRARGRYDIVYFIAAKLAKRYDKALHQLRVPLLWRMRKRSIEKTRHGASRPVRDVSLINPLPRLKCPVSQAGLKRFIIMDDVSTTGFTLMNFLPFLQDLECRPLVIAGVNKSG